MLELTVCIKDLDFLAPLAWGDVVPEGLTLRIEREPEQAILRSLQDPRVDVGEISLTRHLLRLAAGDRSWVGLPFFPLRNLRHRTFYTRRGATLPGVAALRGKHLGLNDWPGTGNTWSRAILRDYGLTVHDLQWTVGGIADRARAYGPGRTPPYVRQLGPDRDLRDLLASGEVDALLLSKPPPGFAPTSGTIVRLFPDFRRQERAWYERTGILPAGHLLGVRRAIYERHPWVLRSLFAAFEAAKTRWYARCRQEYETTPWFIDELEQAEALFGRDFKPNGVTPNRRMLARLCEEVALQGLVDRPLDPDTVFTEFEDVMRG